MRPALLIPALIPLALCAAAPARVHGPPPADLRASASFLPSRYIVENPEERVRVRRYLEGLGRDSSQNFSLVGNVLKLSPALEERLAADEGGAAADSARGKSRQRARLRLERAAGPGIEEDGVAFAAGSAAEYIPDDLNLQAIPQWPLRNDGSWGGSKAGVDIGMTRVWERYDGGDTLVIAVLDAGYNFLHPDLQNTWFVNPAEANGVAGVDDDHNGFVDDVNGWDFVDGDNDPQDYHGHGTQTGGVIAARFDNGIGIAGMLPRVKILPVRVLGSTGYGYTADIANGIRYAAAMKADAINFSIGVNGTTTSTVLKNAFQAARDSGVLVAAAAANDRVNLDATTTQPASYKFNNVYMVAAHNQLAWLSGFSNYGATTVDLAAPGEHIATTTIPAPILHSRETFETFTGARWTILPANGFAVATDSIEGVKSLRWQTGARDTVMLDSIDLRGREGAQMSFAVQFSQAGASDRVIVEAQAFGAPKWDTLVYINGYISSPTTLAYNLGLCDGAWCRLRFRTCTNTGCSTSGSTASRVLRIDDLRIKYADMNPANQAAYVPDDGGTSLAAPYVAGYAALMKLAAKRMGIPLTRQMMLAGTVPEDSLTGKVITGGRLDVAKGLDFYLRTLPHITLSDSADTAWNIDSPVGYALGVADSAGPVGGYAFDAVSGPAGSSLSAGGAFTWIPGLAPPGDYTLRAKAVKGPLTLRKMMRFALVTPVSARAAAPGEAAVLRIGGRAFALPAAALADLRAARGLLRIDLYGADGRTVRSLQGELELPPGARSAEYRISGIDAVAMRVWLNGRPLQSLPGILSGARAD